MQKEMIKNIAELIFNENKKDCLASMQTIHKIKNEIYNLNLKETKNKVIENLIARGVKRMDYVEVLKLFKDYGVAKFEAKDYDEFEDNLYYLNDEKNVDNYYDINAETEVFWNYCCFEDFDGVLAEHLDLDEGLCTLVMLPNDWLQEIPHEYAYKLGGNE
jgi:hypothetical protein